MRSLSIIKKEELDNMLNDILYNIEDYTDWYSFFPRITGYDYMYPNGYEDIEEFPDSFREDDHALAARAVMYPELHERIIKIVERITYLNNTSGILWAEPYEHAGTCFAVELALYQPIYIYLYADFLMSNDLNYENLQSYDIIKIIRKWGLIPETYYLILIRWFIQGENASGDLDYLTYNNYSLKEKLQDDIELEQFIHELELFISKSGYLNEPSQDHYQELFDNLIDEYIFPNENEKSQKLKRSFSEVIEKLKSVSFSELEPTNNVDTDINSEENLPEI